MPDLFDIIELIRDLPEHGLRSGTRGTIVDKHADNAYEVEFIDEHGETIDFLSLYSDQFIIVWKAKTKSWVSKCSKVLGIFYATNEVRRSSSSGDLDAKKS